MSQREDIKKTYKLYIGGKFPRTESGRYIKWVDANNKGAVNICRGSRKDFRNAMVTARDAFSGWCSRTAYNRSQILYRIGEILEGRRSQFMDELILQGSSKKEAGNEINQSIDRLIYYAGWADKYQQIFSRVNPVASSYFNFSYPEPTGVVSALAPNNSSLIGLVSIVAPIIAGGNTVVVLASEEKPLCSITFAEVLHTSDVPGGVVNILTGYRSELLDHFSSHMDV
ncbi:MAG: aldehyde dehydrogenase family protein, partial [Candidatus Marinimicrobia bacterium]|nr:aldehyde dehydrogenase family protein [Candidatus Neomarinimicrobiota bacterium]